MKKFLSLVVAALLLVSAVATTATAAKFTDVDASNEALTEAVDLLVALGVTKGTTDTTFGADENVTRQQMAAFMYRMMKGGKAEPSNSANYSKFTDLVDPYYNYVITWASTEGIIKGRNTENTIFDPNGGIILQDAYTMAVRALGYDEGNLVYPIDYIEKAEELGLDKNIPSTVDYTAALKRGDVAVLLSNMFYAETADVKVSYKGSLETGLEVVEKRQTLAEVAFGVQVVEFTVVGTTNYAFDTAAQDAKNIAIVDTEESAQIIAGGAAADFDNAIEFAKLGLAGKADDYFLSTIVVFAKNIGDEKVDPTIIGAAAKGTKTTIDISKIALGTKTENKDKNNEDTNLTGKITVNGVELDLADVKFIDVKDAAEWAKNATTNNYVAYEVLEIGGETNGDYTHYTLEDEEKTLVVDNEGLYNVFNPIELGALGEVDVYDVDGDGKAEYLFVKPYSVVKLDTDKHEDEDKANELVDFETLDKALYTQTAILSGETFEKDDIVLAYVNVDARLIKVAKVLEPVVATVKGYDNDGFTLSTGAKVAFENIEATIVNGDALPEDATAFASADLVFDGEKLKETKYYFVGDKLVAIAGLDAADKSVTDPKTNWAIVLGEVEDTTTYPIVDGRVDMTKPNTTYSVKVFLDGKIQDVKVAEDFDFDTNTLAIVDEINKDGEYSFIAYTDENEDLAEKVAFAESVDGLKDAEEVVDYVIEAEEVEIKKNDKGYIEFTGFASEDMGKIKGLTALDGAQFIIQSLTKKLDENGDVVVEDEEIVYEPTVTVYTAETLPKKFADSEKFTAFAIFSNNTASTLYENIVVFYGIYEGEIGAADVTDTFVYVANSKTDIEDKDGKPTKVVTYSAYGVDGVLATYESASEKTEVETAFGDIYKLDTDNKIADTDGAIGNIIEYAKGDMEVGEIADLVEATDLQIVVIDAFNLADKRVEIDGKEYTLKDKTVYVKVDEKAKTFAAGTSADIKVLTEDEVEEDKYVVMITDSYDSENDITYINEMFFITLDK